MTKSILDSVPTEVLFRIKHSLGQLRAHDWALFSTQRVYGPGWRLAVEVRDRAATISDLNRAVEEFRVLAAKNGTDGDQVILLLGGCPDCRKYGPPAPSNGEKDVLEIDYQAWVSERHARLASLSEMTCFKSGEGTEAALSSATREIEAQLALFAGRYRQTPVADLIAGVPVLRP